MSVNNAQPSPHWERDELAYCAQLLAPLLFHLAQRRTSSSKGSGNRLMTRVARIARFHCHSRVARQHGNNKQSLTEKNAATQGQHADHARIANYHLNGRADTACSVWPRRRRHIRTGFSPRLSVFPRNGFQRARDREAKTAFSRATVSLETPT